MIKKLKDFELEEFGQLSRIMAMIAEIDNVSLDITSNSITIWIFGDCGCKQYVICEETDDRMCITLTDLEVMVSTMYNAVKYCEVA